MRWAALVWIVMIRCDTITFAFSPAAFHLVLRFFLALFVNCTNHRHLHPAIFSHRWLALIACVPLFTCVTACVPARHGLRDLLLKRQVGVRLHVTQHVVVAAERRPDIRVPHDVLHDAEVHAGLE